jgi:hypothetical protein
MEAEAGMETRLVTEARVWVEAGSGMKAGAKMETRWLVTSGCGVVSLQVTVSRSDSFTNVASLC